MQLFLYEMGFGPFYLNSTRQDDFSKLEDLGTSELHKHLHNIFVNIVIFTFHFHQNPLR